MRDLELLWPEKRSSDSGQVPQNFMLTMGGGKFPKLIFFLRQESIKKRGWGTDDVFYQRTLDNDDTSVPQSCHLLNVVTLVTLWLP